MNIGLDSFFLLFVLDRLADQRTVADEQIQLLPVNHLGRFLLKLFLRQVHQKVRDHEHRIASHLSPMFTFSTVPSFFTTTPCRERGCATH